MLHVTEQVQAVVGDDGNVVLVQAGWDLRDANPEADEHRLIGNFPTRDEAVAAAGEPVRVFVLDRDPVDGYYPHETSHREA